MPRILIVDDEVENLNALKRALGDENPTWEIFTAKNEREGKKVLEEQQTVRLPIDVVLTDLVLESEERGGINGFAGGEAHRPFGDGDLVYGKREELGSLRRL